MIDGRRGRSKVEMMEPGQISRAAGDRNSGETVEPGPSRSRGQLERWSRWSRSRPKVEMMETAGGPGQLPPVEAVCAGVHLHALAGDLCAARLGEYAMTATDLIETLPAATMKMLEY